MKTEKPVFLGWKDGLLTFWGSSFLAFMKPGVTTLISGVIKLGITQQTETLHVRLLRLWYLSKN